MALAKGAKNGPERDAENQNLQALRTCSPDMGIDLDV